MNSQQLLRKKLPDTPGVYFFLGQNKKVLYIGRATSLRNRVRSYFQGDLRERRSPWIAKMLPLVQSIDFTKTGSVLEAILLEADLIKRFKPSYNTELKDDKSFNCIVITTEEFPRVLIERSKNIDFQNLKLSTLNFPLSTFFGPFPNGSLLRSAMKIIRKIFPWRDENCTPLQGKPCFNRQIGLCPGVCTGAISSPAYRQHIKRLEIFLSGNTDRVVRALTREMKQAARIQEFEKAGEYKRQLFALQHIQDISLLKNTDHRQLTTNYRIEAYDLSHFGGKEIVGAMAVVENGMPRPSEYRLFKLRTITTPHETAGLSEMFRRRLGHPEWRLPNLMVVDGNEVQKRAGERVLRNANLSIPIVAVVKDERHRPRDRHTREILLANSEAHRFVLNFQRKKRRLTR